MNEPIWLLQPVIETVHDMQMAEHGGAPGIRDRGLLESALMRPRNLHANGTTDIFELAAAYTFGIAQNHPYVDSDKRTAFLAAYIFLTMNGYTLIADEISATLTMLSLAAATMPQKEFCEWLRVNSEPEA